jgi:hypothetical protein
MMSEQPISLLSMCPNENAFASPLLAKAFCLMLLVWPAKTF